MWSRHISVIVHMFKWREKKNQQVFVYEIGWLREVRILLTSLFVDSWMDVLLLFLYLLLLFCFVIITSVSLMESLVCFFFLGCSCPISFARYVQLWKCISFNVPSLHIGYTNIFMYWQNKAQRHVIGILSECIVPVFFLLFTSSINNIKSIKWNGPHERVSEQQRQRRPNDDICNPYYFICILYLSIKKSRRNTAKPNEIYRMCANNHFVKLWCVYNDDL